MSLSALGIIPARMASTRFPGKPLAMIAGKPMILRVVERAALCPLLSSVVVATDHQQIHDLVTAAGAQSIMTSPDHPTGLDRVCEVADKLSGFTHYLNIQGDEPLIDPETLTGVLENFNRHPDTEISTAAFPFQREEDYRSPDQVKVVFDDTMKALYFSRSPIPHSAAGMPASGAHKHLGIYGYSADALRTIRRLKQHPLEMQEKLEQLRFLARGMVIRIHIAARDSVGIDRPEDVLRAEAAIRSGL